ncbi:hypothetical protein [Haloplanus sp.]|uniref:hypothetical protein n=1 Tax=Haloplanus sp. TaxID=1961696 RepID=UPI0026307458|nr:hypothetical protein [Haloplanus sp.]
MAEDERVMSGEPTDRPYGGTCPACKRDYRRAITLTPDGVLRGDLSGDVCITPDYLFAHSEITVSDPDGDFPTKEVGGMGNRVEVPIDRTEVSGVRISGDDTGTADGPFVFPDDH